MRSLDKLSVVVDSNEFYHGNTWEFPGFSVSARSLLKFGCDYSIRGLVGTIGIERKSFPDYVRCVGIDWNRFQKQLAKLQRNKFFCVIVEGSVEDQIKYSRMTPESVILRTAQIATMQVPVIFAGNRANANLLCIDFMRASMERIRIG